MPDLLIHCTSSCTLSLALLAVAIVPPRKKAKVYVKRPLTAFMLFMKNNRGELTKLHANKSSAFITKIGGRKVFNKPLSPTVVFELPCCAVQA